MNLISIWGVFPPPVGGVSVHIKKEAELLFKNGMLDKVFWFNCDRKNLNLTTKQNYLIPISNLFRYTILSYLYGMIIFLLYNKAKTIHFHNSVEGAWFILFINRIMKKKVVITVHDQMRIIKSNKVVKFEYLLAGSLFKNKKIRWIAVNSTIKNQLMEKGVSSEQIKIIPAYIRNDDIEPLPETLNTFTAYKKPLLSIYAFSTKIFNGNDLYGIDLAIDLMTKLVKKYIDAGLVICIPGIKNENIMELYNKKIIEGNVQNNIFFQKTPLINCNELWAKSDIFLRPTNTDGDALSVREALNMSCVVVASDCVARPSGTVVFRNRDLKDFQEKVFDVLDNKEFYKNKIPAINDFYNLLYDQFSE